MRAVEHPRRRRRTGPTACPGSRRTSPAARRSAASRPPSARGRCRRRASRRTCRPPRTRSRSARSAGRGARRRGRGSRRGPRPRGRAPSPARRAARASPRRSARRTPCRPRRTTGPATGTPPASRRGRSTGGPSSRSTASCAGSSAAGSSKVCAKLTPCSGDCGTPRIVAGGSIPSTSSTVGTMSMMCAYCSRTSPVCVMPLRPADDERVRGPAAVGLALPAPKRRVARERPAPRVVVEVLRPADLVDRREAVLERLLRVVEELRLVRRAGRAALGARAVVRDHHDQRVLELADALQVVEQPPDVMVGVAEEARRTPPSSARTGGAGRR